MTEYRIPETEQTQTYADVPSTVQPDRTWVSGVQRVPLLSRRVSGAVVIAGVVLGIVGPVLLWLNLGPPRMSFAEEVGYLLVLIGVGVVLIGVPLLLIEATRPERGRAGDGMAVATPPVAEPRRGLTGSRLVALIGVLVIVVGAFLMQPVEPPVDQQNDRPGRGQDRGGGRGN